MRIFMTSGSWPLLVIQVGRWRIEGSTPYQPHPVELLQHLLPSQTDLALNSWDFDTDNHQVVLNLTSTQAVAHCPLCSSPTHRVHSRYERILKDLPFVQFSLTILLQVCKFFCLNQKCPRRIFTEPLPNVVAPWARRTARYGDHLKAMGLALGGSAAPRLSHQIGYGHSRNSFLRAISSLPLPDISTPKILGVDDFAFRKGHDQALKRVESAQIQAEYEMSIT